MSQGSNPRWRQRPTGSTWGDFGPDDQLGRLNLLTPEKVKQGLAEVHDGLSFCLSLPLNYPGEAKLNPRRKPPQIKPTSLRGKPFLNFPLSELDARNTDVICDDQVLMSLQYSTQWDSFAHVGSWFDADPGNTVCPLATSSSPSMSSTSRRCGPSCRMPSCCIWRSARFTRWRLPPTIEARSPCDIARSMRTPVVVERPNWRASRNTCLASRCGRLSAWRSSQRLYMRRRRWQLTRAETCSMPSATQACCSRLT